MASDDQKRGYRGRLPEGFDPVVPVEEGERLRIRPEYGTFRNIMGSYFYEVVRQRLQWVNVGVVHTAKTPKEAKRYAKGLARSTQRNHRIREEKKRMSTEETFPTPTVAMIRDWWVSHPDARATRGMACGCIIAKPLAALWGRPVTFVPADYHVNVWDKEGRSGKKIAMVDVPLIFRKIGSTFDNQAFGLKSSASSVSAAECLATIDAVVAGRAR